MEYVGGADARPRHSGQRACALTQALRYAIADRRRAGEGARSRHHPSRPEAVERHGHRRRSASRFSTSAWPSCSSRRSRAAEARTATATDDRRGHDGRHRGLHVARAGRGPQGRRALRHLQLRRRALRDGDRPAAVQRRFAVCRSWRRSSTRIPPPPSASAASVPPDLERAILRCLRKDPARRYQTMADLKVALEDLAEESGAGCRATAPAARVSRAGAGPWAALVPRSCWPRVPALAGRGDRRRPRRRCRPCR